MIILFSGEDSRSHFLRLIVQKNTTFLFSIHIFLHAYSHLILRLKCKSHESKKGMDAKGFNMLPYFESTPQYQKMRIVFPAEVL